MYAFLIRCLRLKTDRRGVTALEYGLIAALLAGVLIAVVATLGTQISDTFKNVGTAMTNANTKAVTAP